MDLVLIIQSFLGPLVRAEVEAAVEASLVRVLPEAIRRARLPEFMTRAEAAGYLGRSVRSLDGLRASGKLAWSKRGGGGGRVMLKTSDLDEYLEAGRVPARSQTGVGQ